MDWTLMAKGPMSGQDRLGELIRYFQHPQLRPIHQQAWHTVLFLLALVGIAWLLVKWLVEKLRTGNHPWILFFTLCWRHRLSLKEQWLLWKLARHRVAEFPAQVFLNPDLFQPDCLPSSWRSQAHLLGNLRSRLFGNLPGTSEALNPTAPSPLSGKASGEQNSASPMPVGFPLVVSPGLDLPPWKQAVRHQEREKELVLGDQNPVFSAPVQLRSSPESASDSFPK